MISQLSRTIIDQTQDYNRLQQMVAQARSVQDTENLLTEISTDLHKWVVVYRKIEPLLSQASVSPIQTEARKIARLLVASSEEFGNHNFQQAVRLTQVKNRVDKLRETTRQAWSEYSSSRLKPYHELAKIAERLPKMSRHTTTVQSILGTVYQQTIELPKKPETVEQFHDHLARLQSLLSELEGLPSDVRVFLDRLTRGDATLADVTQAVFDWCRAEGMVDKLHITYR